MTAAQLRTWTSRLCALVIICAASWLPAAVAADPNQGPGGPILVVTSSSPSAKFGRYYAEILRNEGLNSFAVADISTVNSTSLAPYGVVILAKMPLSAGQVTALTDWVTLGGNLIAMDPDPALAGLLGIAPAGSTLSNGYILVDASASAGQGIASETMQFHGTATQFSLAGATRLATLYSSATTATPYAAVTVTNVGASGGQAAAFAYDLATSIVYTRQGNPAWAGQERDGFAPIRSNDLFYGASGSDPQPDWVDRSKVHIPQADEQQRFLANLITRLNMDRAPLPRFWYFPNGYRAALLMSGDDHGSVSGPSTRFNQLQSLSTPGCSVANWECLRGTTYIYPNAPLSNTAATAFAASGFEVALHGLTNCADFTPSSLDSFLTQQLASFQAKYTGVPAPTTHRIHCLVWSDWASNPKIESTKGIRLNTSYYYWPPGWVNDVPGHFTGSAMPMRFADVDGTLIDSYQAVTQMTDESGQTYPYTVDTLLDRVIGLEQYGVYTVNAHTDPDTGIASSIIASAGAYGVPVISARQLLDWLDARNASSFGAVAWDGTNLTFNVVPGPGANGLRALVPYRSATGTLDTLTRAGSPVYYEVLSVKGIDYASFPAVSGAYVASYISDSSPPTVSSRSPANGATGVAANALIEATFSEPMDPVTIGSGTFELRDSANSLVTATVSYNGTSRKATLRPSSVLTAGMTYTATVRGGTADPRAKDLAGNSLAASETWSFTVEAASGNVSIWDDSAVPAVLADSDTSSVELGVKFRVDVPGYVKGVRFYKGTGNGGTHTGSLWSSAGVRLATATFTNETSSGWQQVNFATPVAVAANTVYVASYFAPQGRYSVNNQFFASAGADRGVLHFLQDGVSGGNGVYGYGTSSTFPSATYQASNYWVDVIFSTTVGGGGDTTPPAVTVRIPSANATGVSVGTTITASFSEALDPSTVNGSTVELRTAANTLVTGTVSYTPSSNTVTLTPGAALAAGATYTATLKGGTADPRIKDTAGNALAADSSWSFTTASGTSCSANPVVIENCLTGNPASEWDVSGAGDSSIQGFATQISVNRGTTVSFKVKTTAAAYRFDIYRLGYYGGMGARKVATVQPSASLPQTQPNCLTDSTTGLVDCGNWAVSGSWAVPATATSGIYIARLVRTDTGGASHIVFVVRDDASTSDILFQTSDTTWQAYNNYGGNSLYTGSPAGRAYKVSYNRPFNTRAVDGGQDWLFHGEYPMVRWLEANGYNVSYSTGVDSDRLGSLIRNHRVFMSNGHDEYWSAGQRTNVEAARDAGVNLAFFSGNEVFWKTRWENSIDGSATAYRTLVSYKETHANAKIDPNPAWTGTWRDARFSPPADGGRPENRLTGTLFMVNGGGTGSTASIVVPDTDGKLRFWRNTSVATLNPGTSATMPFGTLGYEWDVDADNGFRPDGLIRLSTTSVANAPILLDNGSTYGTGTAVHSLTLYKAPSGALVFGAGTIQWAWGLDASHDGPATPTDTRMQQATVNLLADMAVQPATLRPGLSPATASTDTAAPTTTITLPAAGSSLPVGVATTITGTATDAGGLVGGVEVSVDGGATWRRAQGRASWSFSWTPTSSGTVTLRARAADDSGNLESAGPGRTVSVGGAVSCPCSIWSSAQGPSGSPDVDPNPVELGTRFRSGVDGTVTALRFYKSPQDTGTHVGRLWSASGTLLATVTFTGESSSGWQQATLPAPVPITANTWYVASYHTTGGSYFGSDGFFASTGVSNGPLYAARDAEAGGNGVYRYGSGGTLPTQTYMSENYWVDVVFMNSGGTPDTTPPTLAIGTNASALKAGDVAQLTFTLSEPSTSFTAGDVAVAGGTLGSFAGSGSSYTATLTPAANSTTPATVTVAPGTFADAAGNANVVGAQLSIAVDTVRPTIAMSISDTLLETGEVGLLTFTLSEPSATFAAADVTVTGATLGAFAGSGASYTASLTPAPNSTTPATVNVAGGAFTDAAGNGNTAATQLTVSVNTVSGTAAPVVTISTNDTTLNATDVASLTFALSAPSTDFVAGDVVVSGATLSGFSGSGALYTASLTPAPNSTAPATVTVPAGAFTNSSGTANVAATPLSMTVDTIAPTVAITDNFAGDGSGPADATVTGNVTFTFTFSEAVTGFATGDIAVTGGTKGTFTALGATSYSLIVTPTSRLVTVNVPAASATDAVGNGNVATQATQAVNPRITNVTDNINALDGGTGSTPRSVAANTLTDDTRPTIVGTGLQGTTVDIYDTFNNGTSTVIVRLGAATVSSSGSWSFTPVNANWTVSAGTATGRFYAGSHTFKAISTFGAPTLSTDPGSNLYSISVAAIVQTTVTAGVVTGGGTFTFGLFDFNGDGVFDPAGGWARANAVDAAYNNLTLPSQTQLGTANLTPDASDNLWTRTSATGGHRYQVSPGVFATAPDSTTYLRAAYILN